MSTNKQWVLKGQIVGAPTADNFSIEEIPSPPEALGDDEFVIKSDYFSVDPYLRGQFNNPAGFGKVISCYVVGTVIASNNSKMAVGNVVTGILPAQLYITSKDATIRVIDTTAFGTLPLSYAVGVLGMPGATAHELVSRHVAKDDAVFINGSCGIVGSMAAQLARKNGAKFIIGSAGSDEKCKLAVEKYGYDVCINYKQFTGTDEEKMAGFTTAFKAQLEKANLSGVNLYVDLVGGWMTDAVFSNNLVAFQGKVVVVGAIDEYNTTISTGPRLLMKIVYQAITLHGFLVFSYFGPQFPEYTARFEGDIIPALKSGQLTTNETIIEGFDNIADAFIGLFTGKNVGKMVVKA